jgi:hypothetical protein
MSEADVEQNEPRRPSGADNDVFSTSFVSMMSPCFRSPIPVQSPEEKSAAEHRDVQFASTRVVEVLSQNILPASPKHGQVTEIGPEQTE